MREFWPVILALVVAAVVIAFALAVAFEPKPQPPAAAAPATPGAPGAEQQPATDPTEAFYQYLEENQPRYVTVEYSCPVDGTKFKEQSLFAHNRLGGVATDFMSITLAPPEGPHERPSLEQQEWELLPATCPTCGATFMEVDLLNMKRGMVAGAEATLKKWKLSELSPELQAIPQAQWTPDQRLFARYLSTKLAGFPRYELGFYALAAAYATNFSYWSGEPRRWAAPSPAYYALAAAEFRLELDNPESRMNDGERAVVQMTLGELYRLLGRTAEAAEYFKQARKTNLAERGKYEEALAADASRKDLQQAIAKYDQTLKVLDLLEQHLAQGDLALMRVPDIGLPDPPVGWYLDEMLPAINGHIVEHRAAWNTENDPAALSVRIRQVYAGQAAPPQ